MKKLLGILILSLLLSGNAYAFTSWNYQKGYVYIALKNNQNLDTQMSKQKKILQGLNCSKGFHKDELKDLPLGYAEDAPELLKKKYQPLRMYKITCQTDQTLQAKNKVEIADMINKAKDTCKSLGFKEGTEKFADCSLKLYSQSVELAAKQKQTVVMQPQSSGSNVMTIYDPVRDSNALMNKGMKMLSGGCTLGVNC